MLSLVPEVHLVVCLDPRIAPGSILHSLDLARALDWKHETVLICDESWKTYVNIDQPVLFIDRDKIFLSNEASDVDPLDHFLEQLDHFQVQKITQVGELYWGRWLETYFSAEYDLQIQKISWDSSTISSLQTVNDIAQELALDLSLPACEEKSGPVVYVDPYDGDQLSSLFQKIFSTSLLKTLPSWLCLIVKEEDRHLFEGIKDFENSIVGISDVETSLFNQPVVCFSEMSPFVQTSRSYPVAIIGSCADKALFVPEDLQIAFEKEMHLTELVTILSYWRLKRLRELAFQWMNMDVEIHFVESFHSRLVRRNLLNYSTDLYHCQIIISDFVSNGREISIKNINELILSMRKTVNNDPYALSFSLKILRMIVERMIASAECGERLFVRLGSDYHRIVIGEALIEGLIEGQSHRLQELDVKQELQSFLSYLIKIDDGNDRLEQVRSAKELT